MVTETEPFDAPAAGRDLLRTGLVGTLATVTETGAPYASLIEIASDSDGAPVTLISTLAVHTRNLARDARASILIDRRADGPVPLTRARVSLTGRLEATGDPRPRRRFLAHHPDAAMYADFGDFSFYRLAIDAGHLVAGFGRIVDLTPSDLLTDLGDADTLIEAEDGIVEHMNDDHAGAIDLYAQHFAGRDGGGFRCAGCDPSGLTLIRGGEAVHVGFSRPVKSPGVLRQVLKDMAGTARAG